ncbi:MAG: hypothetical protein R3F13_17230 [Prosthecobacter sp.]
MIIRKAPAAPSSHDTDENVLVFDEAPEFMDDESPSDSLENVDQKVKDAQEQLLKLRMQQEEIERQKQHLEALRIKQERFMAGKRELLDKLARCNNHVERELFDSQKRVEQLTLTYDEFRRHLDILKALQPEKWHRSQVDEELENALSAIENAENDYAKGLRRLHALTPPDANADELANLEDGEAPANSPVSAAHSDDIVAWMRRGFAFTLPLMATLLVAIILIRLMF